MTSTHFFNFYSTSTIITIIHHIYKIYPTPSETHIHILSGARKLKQINIHKQS